MPFQEIAPAGQYGIVKDVPGHKLPEQAFSDGQNVEFVNGVGAGTVAGYRNVYEPLSAIPYYTLNTKDPSGQSLWLYAGLNNIYSYNGVAHADITRSVGGNYAAVDSKGWTHTALGNAIVLNNGVDAPQMWNPIGQNDNLADLTAWPAGVTVDVIRSFKQYLIALDVTEGGTNFPQRVKWSDIAAVADIPPSWDETDPTTDAGQTDLNESGGRVVDCLPLGDVNVIYKTDSTIIQQLLSGNLVFQFNTRFKVSGMIARDCAVNYRNQHFVFTEDDIVVHNLQSISSVINNKWKRWLFGNLSAENYERSFVKLLPRKKQVMVAFPQEGSTYCNCALLIDIDSGSVGIRDLPNVSNANVGSVDLGDSEAWDPDTEVWNADNSFWNSRMFDPESVNLVMASPADDHLYFVDEALNTEDGANKTCLLQRTGLQLARDRAPSDVTRYKLLQRIVPVVECNDGIVFNVRVAAQDYNDGPITWFPFEWIKGVTQHIDVCIMTRFVGVEISTTSNAKWVLHHFGIHWELGPSAQL